MLRHIINGFEAIPALQDELFQDIAFSVWRALPKFKQHASVKTYIARIAHNVLATHVSKAVKKVKTVEITPQHDREDQQKTPFDQLDQHQRQQKLAQAIRSLKLAQRQVITLALEGMNYQEMAETLAISVNLVGVRLQRAKTAVTQKLALQPLEVE